MFLADEMLKRTAKWLRLLGIAVFCEEGLDDDALLKKAVNEELVLLTKDEELCKKAKGLGIECFFLPQESMEEDVGRILAHFKLEGDFPEKTLCPVCGGELRAVKPKGGEVPPDVIGEKRMCWKCSSCGKFYWEGGHWKNIKKTLERIEQEKKRFSHAEA